MQQQNSDSRHVHNASMLCNIDRQEGGAHILLSSRVEDDVFCCP